MSSHLENSSFSVKVSENTRSRKRCRETSANQALGDNPKQAVHKDVADKFGFVTISPTKKKRPRRQAGAGSRWFDRRRQKNGRALFFVAK
jgi:hypothetical protein